VELRDYFKILNRRKWVVIAVTLVTFVVATIGSYLQQPTYSGAATVRVAQASVGSIEYADYRYAERLMNTYAEILGSRPVLEEVIRKLDLSISPEDLATQVGVEVVSDTELLKITVEYHDPAGAKDIANALAAQLVEPSHDMYFGATKSARQILQEQLDAIEDNLQQDRAALRAMLDSSARDQAKVDALNSKIRSQEQVYANLLWQYEKALIAEASRENSAAIVAPAVQPKTPTDGDRETYVAVSTVRIGQSSTESIERVDYEYAERLINTYIEILNTRPVLEEAIKKLDLSVSADDLAEQINAAVVPNTELLTITVAYSDPARAKDIANALADLLVEQCRSPYFGTGKSARETLQEQLDVVEDKLEQDRAALLVLVEVSARDQARIDALNAQIWSQEDAYASLLRQYEQARAAEASRESSVTVVAPAVQPEEPSNPRVKLYAALGALVGMAGGIGLAFLFENLDPTLHSADDLEVAAEASVVGSIPRFAVPRESRHQAVLLDGERRSSMGEPFRTLRSSILALGSGAPVRTLLITSAEHGAGKSTVLANLALTVAEAGKRVVMVDSDFRHPCLHEVFALPNELGLSSVLRDLRRLDAALQETMMGGVRVLTSGPLPPNPAELLGSPKMHKLIEKLAIKADVVLLDSPSILAVADAVVLAPMVDRVLLVAAQDQVTERGLQRALQQLDRVKGRTLGIVFNKADGDGYYHYPHCRDVTAEPRSALRSFLRRLQMVRPSRGGAPGHEHTRDVEG